LSVVLQLRLALIITTVRYTKFSVKHAEALQSLYRQLKIYSQKIAMEMMPRTNELLV